jgi:hypothetical protein
MSCVHCNLPNHITASPKAYKVSKRYEEIKYTKDSGEIKS